MPGAGSDEDSDLDLRDNAQDGQLVGFGFNLRRPLRGDPENDPGFEGVADELGFPGVFQLLEDLFPEVEKPVPFFLFLVRESRLLRLGEIGHMDGFFLAGESREGVPGFLGGERKKGRQQPERVVEDPEQGRLSRPPAPGFGPEQYSRSLSASR